VILNNILETERLIEKLFERCKTQQEVVDLKLHLKSVIDTKASTNSINEEPETGPIITRAKHEAKSWAWHSLGVSGRRSHELAKLHLHPKEAQEILKDNEIYGVSRVTKSVIKNLTEDDFEKFDTIYESLISKSDWPWKLSEWFYNLPNGCTYYEYERMRVKLRKKHVY